MTTSFKVEHEFPNISLEKFVAHLNEPALNRMLEKGLEFSERKLLNRKDSPDGVEWQFRVKKGGDLPKPLQKVIKEDGLSWQETSRFVRKENCIYWEINPESKLLKFHGQGKWQLSPKGAGCKRVIEGQITVDIPLVGKMVEGFIVNELVKGYEVEPKIQEEFYASVA